MDLNARLFVCLFEGQLKQAKTSLPVMNQDVMPDSGIATLHFILVTPPCCSEFTSSNFLLTLSLLNKLI